jgi:hypothetical protein
MGGFLAILTVVVVIGIVISTLMNQLADHGFPIERLNNADVAGIRSSSNTQTMLSWRKR